MLPSDFYAILHWWFVLFILGVAFLPLTSVLFEKFFDKGYIFSKLIGLAMTGYAVFVLGTLHILPFTTLSGYITLFALAAGSIFFLPHKKKLFASLKNSLFTFAIEELLFLGLLIAWAYIHSFGPDIHGLEKFMDYGFIKSFLRAEYFPPKDMWFTPFFINYYYFGHLLTALLIKLSNIAPQIGFNLMLSTIFAFCFVQTFSIGANLFALLKKTGKFAQLQLVFAGLLTALLTTFAGNLHVLYAFFSPYKNEGPVPFWQLQFLPFNFPNSYWYPNATRFIHNTIHEFPIYSWVVADLHGHVLDIPFVLLTIAFLFAMLLNSKSEYRNSKQTQNLNDKNTKRFGYLNFKNLNLPQPRLTRFRISDFGFWHLLLVGFLLAVMYMTNAWDSAIYLLLTGLVLLAINWEKLTAPKKKIEAATHLIVSFLTVALSLALFTLPFNLFFQAGSIVHGIGVLCAPEFLVKIGKLGPLLFEADHCQHSYWWELLMLYGFFYFFVLTFVFASMKIKKHTITDIFVFLLIILSTVLIILPEFIYVKDIYPAHYRANTMFKLVFQAFIMLSISSSYIIVRIIVSSKHRAINIRMKMLYAIYFILTVIFLALVLTYPYLAIKSYYNDLKVYKGLDGIRYLQTQYPSDYAGIIWLDNNIKGQPVILEAQGDSYTDFARVSANTGLPTILGWTVHEWLWRGTYDIPAPRIEEVKTMYETTDEKAAKKLLDKYKVKYVFIGALEYQKYPNLAEAKFKKLGNLLFKQENTKIYRIN